MKTLFNIFLTVGLVVMVNNSSAYGSLGDGKNLLTEELYKEIEANMKKFRPIDRVLIYTPEEITIHSIENAPSRRVAMAVANEYISTILNKKTPRGNVSADLSFLNIPLKCTMDLSVAKELANFKFDLNHAPKELPGAIKLTTYEIDENHNRIKGSLLSFENREDFVDFLKCTFAIEAALNNNN